MQTQSKVWGKSVEIIRSPFSELHHIYIKPSSYCSKHQHRFKSNTFYCLKGCVVVEVWKDEMGLIDATLLKPNEATTVMPGEYHRFSTLKLSEIQAVCPEFKDTDMIEVLELYNPEPVSALDIQRRDTGGSLYTNGQT